MHVPRTLPFRGWVTWLTPEQGGRSSGPPRTPADKYYAATAFVPPRTPGDGSASVVLRVRDRAAWSSSAAAGWLVVGNEGPHAVRPGSVLVVTEGPRVVAYFHVTDVLDTH
ncbi:hypothetical protein ACWEKT_19385 [Nocardia takedensis]|uniref:hypothetical protein n=1 Tax=Nocardia takedensis TaxID=259390 RepID=UPI0002ED9B05|nr:hypothetical protein [Nocardia takedensis]